MVAAEEILGRLLEIRRFVATVSYPLHRRGVNQNVDVDPIESSPTTEEWHMLLLKMLKLAVLVKSHIQKLEDVHIAWLGAEEIDELQFGILRDETTDFFRLWLNYLRLLLAISEKTELPDSRQLLSHDKNAMLLRDLVAEVERGMQTREESQRAIDSFISKHPIPESWNEELVKRNMAAIDRGEGIDARDFIASLPR